MIQQKIQEAVAAGIKELFNAELPANEVQVQETRKEFQGQFTVVVFPLTRISKSSPLDTAAKLGQYLEEKMEEVEGHEVVKGFLNLSLNASFWQRFLHEQFIDDSDNFWEQADKPLNIMLEYSSPNTNKPLHLGHIRNHLLGWSVAEILKARGHAVIKANLINDRGIHICKSMLAWQKFGNGETPGSTGMKGDHLVGKYYVEFDKEYKKELAALTEKGMSKEEAEKQAPLILEAQEMLRKWEAGDPEVISTWKMMNDWVYEGFEQTYKDLGVDFDKFYYESKTYLLGKRIVQDGLAKGVFFTKENGSVWVDLTDEELDEKLLLRGDGTSVYITQDLGTAQERFDEFKLDRHIYTVGNEQEYHFKVLKAIFKKLGRPWYDAIYHLSYGMVELPTGKMKSREGTVVDADDLIAEMIHEAQLQTEELGKTQHLELHEREKLYRQVGMAALKFYILKADPRKQMLFNPAESIDLQGFTGPFVQYTYTRIRSILRKYAEDSATGFTISYKPSEKVDSLSNEELEILQLLYKKDGLLKDAEENLSPALLANYVYDLAKTYNRFYHDHQVLNEPDTDKRNFRLALSSSTAKYIRHIMFLLGIEVPERM